MESLDIGHLDLVLVVVLDRALQVEADELSLGKLEVLLVLAVRSEILPGSDTRGISGGTGNQLFSRRERGCVT